MTGSSRPNEPGPAGGDRERALYRLLQEIAIASIEARDVDSALAVALEQVCAFQEWPVGHAYIRDAQAGDLVSSGLWHLSDPERFHALREVTERTRFAAGVGLPGRVLASGSPHWIPDIRRDPNFTRSKLAQDLGVRAGFAFPVLVRGEAAAVLEFFSPEPREPDEPLLAAMATVGSQLGRVFERLAAQQALRESEARFRALAENATAGIVVIDDTSRILFANPALERMLGYAPRELVGQSLTAIIPEELRAAHRAGMRRYIETGRRGIPWEGVELPGLTRDGREVPLEISFGEFTQDGRRFFSGIIREISDRKRAERERVELLSREQAARAEAERRAREEAALRRATEAVNASYSIEEVIRRIAESALDACAADASIVGRLDVENDSVALVSSAGREVFPPSTRIRYTGSVTQRVIERGKPELLTTIGAAADAGWPIPPVLLDQCADCCGIVLPLLDAGEAIGSLILLRWPERPAFQPDEVARAHTFARLAALAFRKVHLLQSSEKAREELERVMESRARLMRGFSHDLKNPLGAADGYAQLLEQGVVAELPPKALESVQRIRRAIGGALRLIDELVELARAEAGQIEIKWVPVEVRDAAREIAEEYRAAAESKGLRLEDRVPEELPVIVSDSNRIRQILGNLLSNAVKYTDSGAVTVTAAVRSAPGSEAESCLAVEVSDTGPGIPEDKRHLLFQEFTRLGADSPPGAGLGLAISQRLAHALGGRITLSSDVGRGSTFVLWLPLE